MGISTWVGIAWWPQKDPNAGTMRQMAGFDGPLRLLRVVGNQILVILGDKTATLRLAHPKEDQPEFISR